MSFTTDICKRASNQNICINDKADFGKLGKTTKSEIFVWLTQMIWMIKLRANFFSNY